MTNFNPVAVVSSSISYKQTNKQTNKNHLVLIEKIYERVSLVRAMRVVVHFMFAFGLSALSM